MALRTPIPGASLPPAVAPGSLGDVTLNSGGVPGLVSQSIHHPGNDSSNSFALAGAGDPFFHEHSDSARERENNGY